MKKAVVIGGGITGLSVMYYLNKLKKEKNIELDLILVEQNKELGGKISTVKKGEFTVEAGADSIVARHQSVMPLIEDLNLQDELVYNATGISYIHSNQELHPIPKETVFGIPTSVESLFSSTLVSLEGKEAALLDFETKNERFTSDSSIGSFLECFLGKELVEKQIAPVLSGVYSGKLEELTLSSTLPYLLQYKNEYGSIIKGLSENKTKFHSSGNKKFLSFKNGLSTIIKRLEEKLNDTTILKGVKTTSISQIEDHYHVVLDNGDVIQADYVVSTVPHNVSQKLLKNEELNHEFNKLKNSSLISVYLGFDVPDSLLPKDGTGFIVSENSDLKCNACTWSSRKWTHTSQNNHLLVRLFYKSTNNAYESLKNLSEEELVQEALIDVQKSLALTEKPKTVEVTYWNNMMPKYHLGHGQAVQSLNQKMTLLFPNVILAGASYYGVGIGACIQNGKDTAELIANGLVLRQ